MSITILYPGSLSMIQDRGRVGYQASGFSPSGAADKESLHLLNALLSNDRGEAAIEMTAGGISLRFDSDAVFAITGADNGAKLNGQPVPRYTAVEAKRGDELSCGYARNGIRTYFGVAGGLDIPIVMGSRSTGLKFQVGGFHGRKLQAGDVISLRAHISTLPKMKRRKFQPPELTPGPEVLRVVWGPQDDRFSEEAKEAFQKNTYMVSGAMDRMGIRLDGEQIPSLDGYDIISDATVTGSIQVTNAGLPIILLNDRQTTGGYTKIATVISSDLPKAAQLYPGREVQFKAISVEEAQRIYHKRNSMFRRFERRLKCRTPFRKEAETEET